MALVSAEELAWALDISIPLAELAIARVRARQFHEKPPPLLPPHRAITRLIDDRRVWWADE
jgi:hypothetical protein